MITAFITKLFVFIFTFCTLNILREIYDFYMCYIRMEKYEITNLRMFGLWASISFIITIIFTGIL